MSEVSTGMSDGRAGRRWWSLVAICALVVAGCSFAPGADSPVSTVEDRPLDESETDDTIGDPVAPVVPEGFATISAELDPTGARRGLCELCLWMADTDGLRQRGLMGVSDLGGADGMAFVYTEPRTTSFTMRNTLLPLSIAFFDAQGMLLEVFDMEPCTSEPCPSYPTPSGFMLALEVVQGYFEDLGLGPGARLTWTQEPCDPRLAPAAAMTG